MKPKTTSPANRRRAASCLWAYHDARHAGTDYARLGMVAMVFDVREFQHRAYEQYLEWKYNVNKTV